MFGYSFKNKWFKRKSDLEKEFLEKENELIRSLTQHYDDLEKSLVNQNLKIERSKTDLDDLEKRVLDRKKELEKANDELKTQIRLIEAKASPDSVWIQSFSHGFSKAWDMMIPIMTEGIEKVKENIRTEEIDKSLIRVNPIVEDRLKALQNYKAIESLKLEEKKKEFFDKMNDVQKKEEKEKYKNYISVIDWLLGQRNGN